MNIRVSLLTVALYRWACCAVLYCITNDHRAARLRSRSIRLKVPLLREERCWESTACLRLALPVSAPPVLPWIRVIHNHSLTRRQR